MRRAASRSSRIPFNRVFRHSVQRKVMNRLLRQPEVHPDGIETLNGSFAGIGSSRIAMPLARTVYHWAETGSSDAHTTTAVGCARTIFPGRTAAEFRRAVELRQTGPQGHFWQAREYVAFVSHRMGTVAARPSSTGATAHACAHRRLRAERSTACVRPPARSLAAPYAELMTSLRQTALPEAPSEEHGRFQRPTGRLA